MSQRRLFEAPDSLAMSAKTAIHRKTPSPAARQLVEHGRIVDNVFDWGCGHGRDTRYFQEQGIRTGAWDPEHRPSTPPALYPANSFDWVHCSYVLNTLQARAERIQIIEEIWDFLPNHGFASFVVRSAKEIERLRSPKWVKLGDGWQTTRGTFQKGFTDGELEKLVKDVGFQAERFSKQPYCVVAHKPS